MKNKVIASFTAGFIALMLLYCDMSAQNLNVAGTLTADSDQWMPLASSGAAFNITNTLVQTTAATFTIPANAMGSNGILRCTYVLSSPSLTLQTKAALISLGGVVIRTNVINSATTMALAGQINLMNINDPQVQKAGAAGQIAGTSYSVQNTPASTFAIDTTVAQTFTIQLTNAVASDSLTLESVSLEVLRRNY